MRPVRPSIEPTPSSRKLSYRVWEKHSPFSEERWISDPWLGVVIRSCAPNESDASAR